jgi:hypothetical protein
MRRPDAEAASRRGFQDSAGQARPTSPIEKRPPAARSGSLQSGYLPRDVRLPRRATLQKHCPRRPHLNDPSKRSLTRRQPGSPTTCRGSSGDPRRREPLRLRLRTRPRSAWNSCRSDRFRLRHDPIRLNGGPSQPGYRKRLHAYR